MTISTLCFIAAVILAGLAAFGVASPRFSLGWAAVAFIALGHTLAGVTLG